MRSTVHKSVLLHETVDGLNLKPGALIIDGTFGGGGHSFEVCKRHKDAHIIGLDQDITVWSRSEPVFKEAGCDIKFKNTNFRNIDTVTDRPVDGIILDLGLSSDQLENSGRGFSFMKDEPLLMTMKENPSSEDVTAREIVNTWGEESLADIIYGYGGEKHSRNIAKKIIEARSEGSIDTTFQLVACIERAIPPKWRKGKIHFATKTFQALRMATNDELGALSEGLTKGFAMLRSGGRMSVISFHSLEDRIVKRFFKQLEDEGKAIIINKKVVTGTKSEIQENPRSRSAKLRIIEKINY